MDGEGAHLLVVRPQLGVLDPAAVHQHLSHLGQLGGIGQRRVGFARLLLFRRVL